MHKEAPYSSHEVTQIRETISRKIRLTEPEIATLRRRFDRGKLPPDEEHMGPFVPLAARNPGLYEKISGDEKAKRYSLFGFFPETFGPVYESDTEPKISFAGETRGLIGIVSHPGGTVVIKPLQSSRENEIADITGRLGVGPEQLPTLDGFLTERFIEGTMFPMLGAKGIPSDRMHAIGRRMGEILKLIHRNEIYYNDVMLSDDFGRSHVIVPDSAPAVLFDYGVALRLNGHPNLSDEEIFNFAKTLPMFNLMLHGDLTEEQVKAVVRDYGPRLRSASKEEIMSRDLSFISEGLFCASTRMTRIILDAFLEGFRETYVN